MSCKKQIFRLNSTYVVSADQNDFSIEGPNTLALIKSNFLGTQYVTTDERINRNVKFDKVIATVQYDSSCCKPSAGPR
jgi:hypothetical protein